jgi:hypothetical protein
MKTMGAIRSARSIFNRRAMTFAAGAITAGALMLGGPAATALAAPSGTTTKTVTKAVTAKPDYSLGGFLKNAGAFAGALGTNTNKFLGTLGTNGEQFAGKLGTNTLKFVGTLGNNLVGNPPNTGGSPTPATQNVLKGNFQTNTGSAG